MLGHLMPEILGNRAVARVAGDFIAARRANRLGNVGIGVVAGQLVFPGSKRCEELLVFKPEAQVAISLFAGYGVEVEADLIHAAMLHQLNLGPLLVAQRLNPLRGPVRHAPGHHQALRVAAIDIHIQQAGHDLVIGVEGRPHRLIALEPVIETGWIRAQIAIRLLALGQLLHQLVGLVPQRLVAGAGKHKRARREIVPAGKVAAQFAVRRLPSAQRLCGRRASCRQPERVQQAVVGQHPEVDAIPLLRFAQRPMEQLDLAQGKGHRFPFHSFIAYVIRGTLRVDHRILRQGSPITSRHQSRTGHCGCRLHKSSPRQLVHRYFSPRASLHCKAQACFLVKSRCD